MFASAWNDSPASRFSPSKRFSRAIASLKELDLRKRNRRMILRHLADVLGRHRVKELMKRITPAEIDVKRSDAYELLRGLAGLKGGRFQARRTAARCAFAT